nr:MAG TPA: Dynein light chain 1 [Caudoviricetes sp.]
MFLCDSQELNLSYSNSHMIKAPYNFVRCF